MLKLLEMLPSYELETFSSAPNDRIVRIELIDSSEITLDDASSSWNFFLSFPKYLP